MYGAAVYSEMLIQEEKGGKDDTRRASPGPLAPKLTAWSSRCQYVGEHKHRHNSKCPFRVKFRTHDIITWVSRIDSSIGWELEIKNNVIREKKAY